MRELPELPAAALWLPALLVFALLLLCATPCISENDAVLCEARLGLRRLDWLMEYGCIFPV